MHMVVLMTASSVKEADSIARALVERRLAACVNTLKGLQSVYRWQGRVEKATEVLLIAKTDRRMLKRLIACVKSLHSYQVPEIICLPVTAGDRAYLEWVHASVR